ncbi:MAG: vWA domain-containing protein [Rikenellaceae bacterium]|nr:vWA domain-containing protein [Rikenellaceae bacterium]
MSENKNHPLAIRKNNQSDWIQKLENATGQLIKAKLPTTNSVFFLLDCSGSMSSNNKLQFAKNGGIEYAMVAISKGYKIGLISFGSSVKKILDPQDKIENFKMQISNIEIEGSTNLTDAIRIARELLSTKVGERIIFVVTDGYPDNSNSAISEVKLAAQAGIEIMTLGTDDADLNFLDSIATKKEFSKKVTRQDFQQGIKDMSKLLPSKTKY